MSARRAEHELQGVVQSAEYTTVKRGVELLYPSSRFATERYQLLSSSEEDQKTHHKARVRFGSSLSAPFLHPRTFERPNRGIQNRLS